jgi:hypothetical protein
LGVSRFWGGFLEVFFDFLPPILRLVEFCNCFAILVPFYLDLIPLPWIIFPGSTCNQNLDQFSAGILFGAGG